MVQILRWAVDNSVLINLIYRREDNAHLYLKIIPNEGVFRRVLWEGLYIEHETAKGCNKPEQIGATWPNADRKQIEKKSYLSLHDGRISRKCHGEFTEMTDVCLMGYSQQRIFEKDMTARCEKDKRLRMM